MLIALGIVAFALAVLALYDMTQREHAILRNFPVVGHLRYILETFGPELRQYIVTNNDEELPFSRDQRRWVYASAKKELNTFGFGTDNDIEAPNYLIVKHSAFPYLPEGTPDELYPVPCAKVLGEARQRKHAFRPASIVNTSAMSFGSLSGPAVEAINAGAKLAGCLQNTGEGGISPHHKQGGELIWQIGTGYFGCREHDGRFSMSMFLDNVAANPVRAIEIKLSQGAKPGKGGLLPGAKVTPEIAAIRGIPVGVTCASPSRHTAFSNADEMLDFVERLADESGLPVGIKSAVGESAFWESLADLMAKGDRGVDFITIDGGEGGTGAAPLVFSDHVSLPFKVGFPRVYTTFAERGVHELVAFAGSGKLGFPQSALLAIAMGCDLIQVGREAMLAIGCIQAQRCHSGHCPTGVATQSPWLVRGLDPTSKSQRLANYVITLRKEIEQLAHACGRSHPALITLDDFELLDDALGTTGARERFGYQIDWGLPSSPERRALGEFTMT